MSSLWFSSSFVILLHAGNCTWGMNCRFIHPGVNDKGNYSLISKPDPFPPNGAPPGGPHPLIPNNPWVGCHGPGLHINANYKTSLVIQCVEQLPYMCSTCKQIDTKAILDFNLCISIVYILTRLMLKLRLNLCIVSILLCATCELTEENVFVSGWPRGRGASSATAASCWASGRERLGTRTQAC